MDRTSIEIVNSFAGCRLHNAHHCSRVNELKNEDELEQISLKTITFYINIFIYFDTNIEFTQNTFHGI